MQLSRYLHLLSAIDDAIDQQSFVEALSLVLANIDRVEDDAPLRERVAMVLASAGRRRDAVQIWDRVARHWANAGHPTRSLAAIKQMQALRPEAGALLDHFSALYNIQSPYLDDQLEAPHLTAPSEELEFDTEADEETSLDDLLERSFGRAMEEEGLQSEPSRLPPVPLLSLLPAEVLRPVVDHLEYEILAEAEPIVEADQPAEELFWTVTADFLVEGHNPPLRLPSGALLGLQGFGDSSAAPTHTTVGLSGSEVLRLSAEAIDEIDGDLGDFRNRLSTLRRHALTEGLLERLALFNEIEPADRTDLMEHFRGVEMATGEVLVEQDARSPGIFIVLDGQVDVVRSEEGWEITIATLDRGQIFGEVGVVSDNDTLAECVVNTGGHLLYLPHEEFGAVAEQHPSMARFLVNLANERIEEVESTLSAKDVAEVD
ncbi:MAG: Crp/Fnr family transcriptional regulator [Persicimonas sp.]